MLVPRSKIECRSIETPAAPCRQSLTCENMAETLARVDFYIPGLTWVYDLNHGSGAYRPKISRRRGRPFTCLLDYRAAHKFAIGPGIRRIYTELLYRGKTGLVSENLG